MYCCDNCGSVVPPRQKELIVVAPRPLLGGTVGPLKLCPLCHEGHAKGIPLAVLKRKFAQPPKAKRKALPPPVEVAPPLVLQPTRAFRLPEPEVKGKYPAKKVKRLKRMPAGPAVSLLR